MREVAHSEDMKKFAKSFVFLKINVDVQKNVVQAYNVTGLPTFVVAEADGTEKARTMGYGNPGSFYSWLQGQI